MGRQRERNDTQEGTTAGGELGTASSSPPTELNDALALLIFSATFALRFTFCRVKSSVYLFIVINILSRLNKNQKMINAFPLLFQHKQVIMLNE